MNVDRRPVQANGAAAQVYLRKTLVTDTEFPLEADQEVLIQPTDCGRATVVVPIDVIPQYPLRVTEIPAEARDLFSSTEHEHLLNGQLAGADR